MAVDFPYSHDHPQEDQEQDQEHEDREQELDDEEEAEDDYIDMEVSSYYSNFLKNSPIRQSNEFEFMTQSGPLDRNPLSTTSPADELFYKGKLLPLHLPPRLQIMQTLLHNNNNPKEFYTTPLSTNATTTPFLSCNVSPVESCHVSKELNPEEYFLECSNDEEPFPKKSSGWARKLKMIKQSSLLGSKIKASSRAYLKFFFRKSGEPSSTKLASHRSLGTHIESAEIKDEKVCHRRSFSGAFKLRAITKSKTLTPSSSSSSSSSNSNGLNDVKLLKRSNSAKLELESAIAGAIAHCKQSNNQPQVLRSRKTFSEIGVYDSQFVACEE